MENLTDKGRATEQGANTADSWWQLMAADEGQTEVRKSVSAC